MYIVVIFIFKCKKKKTGNYDKINPIKVFHEIKNIEIFNGKKRTLYGFIHVREKSM